MTAVISPADAAHRRMVRHRGTGVTARLYYVPIPGRPKRRKAVGVGRVVVELRAGVFATWPVEAVQFIDIEKEPA